MARAKSNYGLNILGCHGQDERSMDTGNAGLPVPFYNVPVDIVFEDYLYRSMFKKQFRQKVRLIRANPLPVVGLAQILLRAKTSGLQMLGQN